LGHLTTGAGNDLQRATDLARKMVCEWGMSDKLGPLTFGKREEQIFLGKEFTKHKDYSEKTAEEIDEEIKKIVAERYAYAKRLLLDNKTLLTNVAMALLEKETLGAADIEAIVQNGDKAYSVSGSKDDADAVPEATA
ncbi:MAG: cell division protein FtsH, partial [Nitrospira bacterium SG8_35_4]